jgi:alpha-N-arabinofuranosidase
MTGFTTMFLSGHTVVYNDAKLPVWMSGNVFYNGAKPCKTDQNFLELPAHQPDVRLEETGEGVVLYFTLETSYYEHKGNIITTGILGKAKIPKAAFDNPDGTPLRIDRDYFGKLRPGETTGAGPFSHLNPGEIVLKVW